MRWTSPRRSRSQRGAETIAAQESVTQVSFHIPFPVSVARGAHLVAADRRRRRSPSQRVALYDPQTDRRHPLAAAEFVNDSKAGLPPGIVTIYESGANGASYVGDSRLSATPAGEKRLLSFALDQKTTIEEDDSDNTSLARARIAKGVLTIDDLSRRRTVYHVKADEPRRLIVYVAKLAGGRLTEPAATDVTEAEGRYRVPFDVKAGDGQTFAVTQESTQTRAVALANLDDANLGVYARSGADRRRDARRARQARRSAGGAGRGRARHRANASQDRRRGRRSDAAEGPARRRRRRLRPAEALSEEARRRRDRARDAARRPCPARPGARRRAEGGRGVRGGL